MPRSFRLLLLGSAINRVGSFLIVFIALYVKSLGYSTFLAGAAASLYGVGYFLASIIGGQLTDRFGRRRTIVLSMVSSAATLIAFTQFQDITSILILGTLAGVCSELYRPASAAMISDLLPVEDRVVGYGAYRFSINFGGTIGILLGGVMADQSFEILFWVDAAMSLGFAAVALLGLPGGRPPVKAEEAEEEETRSAPKITLMRALRLDPLLPGLLSGCVALWRDVHAVPGWDLWVPSSLLWS
jgi:MFS family permease